MVEPGDGTFTPLDLRINAVYFYIHGGQTANPRLVVAQTWHETAEGTAFGPVGIYTGSQLMAENTTIGNRR